MKALGTPLVLALIISTSLASAQVSTSDTAGSGAFLNATTSNVRFLLDASMVASAPGVHAYASPSAGAPFSLIATLPNAGMWYLTAQFSQPLTDTSTLRSIPLAHLEVKADPTGFQNIAGCIAVPWSPVGAGLRLTKLTGPGVCRFNIDVRLELTGKEHAGSYVGSINWNLTPETSP